VNPETVRRWIRGHSGEAADAARLPARNLGTRRQPRWYVEPDALRDFLRRRADGEMSNVAE